MSLLSMDAVTLVCTTIHACQLFLISETYTQEQQKGCEYSKISHFMLKKVSFEEHDVPFSLIFRR